MALSNSMQVVLASLLLGTALGLMLWGMSRDAEQRDYEPKPLSSVGARPLGSTTPPAAPRRRIDTGPARAALARFRKEALELGPQKVPARQIAVSGKRVARVYDDGLVVVEPLGNKRLELPLEGAYLVTAFVGGFVAVGKHKILVLRNDKQVVDSWPRVTLFPGSQVLPDLIVPERLWVHHPGDPTMYGYSLSGSVGSLLPIVAQLDLKSADHQGFLALGDGSFVYAAGERWQRVFSQGKRFQLEAPTTGDKVFRTLGAKRIDEFHVLYESALIQRVQLQDRLHVVWSRKLEQVPIDITSIGNTLVLLNAKRDQARDLRWELGILKSGSDQLERLDLGPSAPDSFDDDWVERQLVTRGLTGSKTWLVLGGREQLRVWDLRRLAEIFREGQL